MSNRRTFRWPAVAALMALTGGLWGCQAVPASAPVPPPAAAGAVTRSGALSAAQVSALQDMGFVEEAQGWTFNISDSKLLFDSGDDTLNAAGRRLVRDIALGLIKIDLTRLRVEGHTDNVGSKDFNQALSLRRAGFVARQFVQNGFSDKGIARAGFGMSKPVADNNTPDGRAQNRRVSLIVVVD